MDLATQEHLTGLRHLLTFRQRELMAAMHAAELLQQDRQSRGTTEVFDLKDLGEARMEQELEASQQTRDRAELAQVEDALHRLDQGCYGDCADCGEPIGMPRLLVQPAARRCRECEAAVEAAARHAASAPHA